MRVDSPGLVEVASGIDALYLSGRVDLPNDLVESLEAARASAERHDEPTYLSLGGVDFALDPRAWGRYRFSLRHPHGRVGLTVSDNLPAVRVQPVATFLHAVGPGSVTSWFADQLQPATGEIDWSPSRLDLFADVTGWELSGDDRDRFACRARARLTHEYGDDFTGFNFGARKGALYGRIYDKTHEAAAKGNTWWKDLWGTKWDGSRVLRVELQYNREILRQFDLHEPTGALASVGDLWKYATGSWLTYRDRGLDSNRSRWDIAPEWTAIQSANLHCEPLGLERIRRAETTATLARRIPQLRGYLAACGALVGAETLEDALRRVHIPLAQYGARTGVSFETVLAKKRRQYGLAI